MIKTILVWKTNYSLGKLGWVYSSSKLTEIRVFLPAKWAAVRTTAGTQKSVSTFTTCFINISCCLLDTGLEYNNSQKHPDFKKRFLRHKKALTSFFLFLFFLFLFLFLFF